MTLRDEKTKLRHAVFQKLREQPMELRRVKSAAVLEKLRRLAEFRESKVLMFYAATDQEVDTKPLLESALREGRCVVVPRIDRKAGSLVPVKIRDAGKDLVAGSYGILEPREELARPFDPGQIDLVLVPGVAFDKSGRRLGRGKGYYDRFLKTLPPRIKRYGLAFDFQIFESVPFGNSDVSVHHVITND